MISIFLYRNGPKRVGAEPGKIRPSDLPYQLSMRQKDAICLINHFRPSIEAILITQNTVPIGR